MKFEAAVSTMLGWPWHILGTIRIVATVLEAAEIFFGHLNNARFPVSNISRNLNTTTSIGEAMKTFGTKF